jgi:hypothetical protein
LTRMSAALTSLLASLAVAILAKTLLLTKGF